MSSSPQEQDDGHPHHHPHYPSPTTILHEAVELHPLQPPRFIHRVHHRVRDHKGRVRTQLVLQPTMTDEGEEEGGLYYHRYYYALDSVLRYEHRKGVTLYLATPALAAGHEEPTYDEDRCGPVVMAPACCPLVSCGSPVVIKAMPQPRNRSAIMVDNPLSEIAAMQHLQASSPHHHHSSIIHLIDCMQDEDFIYLVLPYLPGGDVFSHIESLPHGGGLDLAQATSYFRQMCEGLLHMKTTSRLAHHDVSLENFMMCGSIDEEGDGDDSNTIARIKIIDMGMSLRVPEPLLPLAAIQQQQQHDPPPNPPVCLLPPQPCCGKPSYLSLELVQERAFDPFAADIWSLGVSLYIMMTGRPLYASPHDPAFRALAQGKVREVMDCYETHGLPPLPPCAKDLICSMLHNQPHQRPTLEQILHHPFMATGSPSTATR